jgi:hypothetical protein
MRPLDDSDDSSFRERETGTELLNSYMKVDAPSAAEKTLEKSCMLRFRMK